MIEKFHYLKPALALVLMVVGVKMLAAKWLKMMLGESFNFTILGVILGILATGVAASIVSGKAAPREK
jgi:predicted tellurium resistance membrane protein TerC